MPYTMTNYDELYGNIGNARKMALDSALLNQQQTLAALGNTLKGQYDDVRGQAYTNARTSALGNNESLAALGLAGDAYGGPQSGYSETSRVAQDTALGNALNAANRQEQSARNDLATQGNTAMLNRDQQWASNLADLDAQKISAKTAQDQFAAQYNMQEAQNALAQQNYEANLAYQKAKDAQDQANWQATFDFNKSQAAKSGGGGGSPTTYDPFGSSFTIDGRIRTGTDWQNLGYTPIYKNGKIAGWAEPKQVTKAKAVIKDTAGNKKATDITAANNHKYLYGY